MKTLDFIFNIFKYSLCLVSIFLFVFSLFQTRVAYWIAKNENGFKNKVLKFIIYWLFVILVLLTCSYKLFRKKIKFCSQRHSWMIIRDYLYYSDKISSDKLQLNFTNKIKVSGDYSKQLLEDLLKNKFGVILDHNQLELLKILLKISKDDRKNFRILYNSLKKEFSFLYDTINELVTLVFPGNSIFRFKHDVLMFFFFLNKYSKDFAINNNNLQLLFESEFLHSLLNDIQGLEIDDSFESIKIEKMLNQVNKVGIMVYSLSILKNSCQNQDSIEINKDDF